MKPYYLSILLFFSCHAHPAAKQGTLDSPIVIKQGDPAAGAAGGRDSGVTNLEARDTPAPARAADAEDEPALVRKVWNWPPGPPKDTTIEVDIDGVSLEGSGVKAVYTRDTIRSAEWEIFGESFQCHLYFTFPWNGRVLVKRRFSRYKGSMENVKSDKDMVTDSVRYETDTNGVLLEGKHVPQAIKDESGEIIHDFTLFKYNVPMVLHN